jgi:hypothetical protein
MGTADELVSPARSTELMQCFGAAGDVFEHPGRHGIPSVSVCLSLSVSRSTELMQCFGAAGDVFEYPGRHGIPCSAEFRTRLKAFLAEMAAASVG